MFVSKDPLRREETVRIKNNIKIKVQQQKLFPAGQFQLK